METDDSVDAPADSVKWVKNIFRSRAAGPERTLLRRVIAVLQAEIGTGQPAFGERSASASTSRQILYAAEDAAVDLRMRETGQTIAISGQVIGEGFENASVILAGEEQYLVATNELAEFEMMDIAKGSYTLLIANGETEIVVKNIELGK